MQIWNFVAWCQVCHTAHSMGVAICQGILQVMMHSWIKTLEIWMLITVTQLKSCLTTTQRVPRIVDQNDLQEAQFCIVCCLCPVRERLQNYVVFIWSHIWRNVHQVFVLVKTVSSCFQNFMEHFPFFTSMSFMLWDIHGTFNLFSVLPVLWTCHKRHKPMCDELLVRSRKKSLNQKILNPRCWDGLEVHGLGTSLNISQF
jgi:hypothetical protein